MLTIRDFTQIFDAFTEFSETLISSLMESLSSENDEEDLEGMEEELDTAMKEFEELMDKRPFLVNEVLLRRNGNDVVEWEKRVALWGQDDEKVCLWGVLFFSESFTRCSTLFSLFLVVFLDHRYLQQSDLYHQPPQGPHGALAAVHQLCQVLRERGLVRSGE